MTAEVDPGWPHQERSVSELNDVLRAQLFFLAQHIAIEAREVFDVTGAGDTVIAALGVMLAAGAGLESAVRIANRAAGIVVGKLGTATVSPAELFGKG